MKKTKRIIGVIALLLAALMLFSSCAISYRKVDPSKYIRLADGFDIRSIKLPSSIDKMKVEKSDVEAYINKKLFELREKAEGDVNQPGEYNKYDTLTIRTILYDKDGNLVDTQSNFALGSKASVEDDGTIVLNSEQALYLGYGTGVNEGLLESIEKDLYLKPQNVYLLENQRVVYNNVGGVTAGALGAMPAFGYLTYETSNGQKITSVAVMHFDRIGEELDGKTDSQKKNSMDELIYLGLKTLIEQQKDVEGKQVTPSTTKELKIAVYPVGEEIPAEAVRDATNTAISYNYDFEKPDGGSNYSKGSVTIKLQGTIDFTSDATDPAAFVTTYKFPADETATYEVDGEEKKLADTECTVYTYVIERAPYTRPDYNADTIKDKNKLNFVTDKTADGEVIAEYESSIQTRLQNACDALALEAVKEALLAQVLANATLIKDPVRNIKRYVKNGIAEAREQYISGGYREKKNANDDFMYDNFEDFLINTYYKHKTDAEGNIITFASLKAVKEDLYAEGRELVKENLLIYYLADELGCRLTEDELLAMAKERGAAWAKEQIEAGRDYLEKANTVANLEKSYPDSYASTTSTMTQKEELFQVWGATSYEDCLAKQLAYYGEMYGETFETWGDYAKAAYPDDAYDWKDYVESKGGKENLYGIFHAERVLDKLVELNADAVAKAYKEVPFDAGLVDLEDE